MLYLTLWNGITIQTFYTEHPDKPKDFRLNLKAITSSWSSIRKGEIVSHVNWPTGYTTAQQLSTYTSRASGWKWGR